MKARLAKFGIGQVVRHRRYPFRGLIYDVDPVFANTEEWWLAIPEDVRPRKDQPFYHLFAEKHGDRVYRLRVGAESSGRRFAGAAASSPDRESFSRTADGGYVAKAPTRN